MQAILTCALGEWLDEIGIDEESIATVASGWCIGAFEDSNTLEALGGTNHRVPLVALHLTDRNFYEIITTRHT